MPWPFTSVLDILEGVRIRSMIVLKMRTANGPTAAESLLLADVQRELTPSSLGISLNPLAISLRGFAAVPGLHFVVDAVYCPSVLRTADSQKVTAEK